MPAVLVKDVVKDYKIYSLRGQKFKEWLTFNRRRYHDLKRALDGVSFDVAQGECLGIIGDNGSGKSTILKLLAGTSYPTQGQIQVDGVVSYILDVSTGFNFDFTGRENIYTKCALLGMPADQIVATYPSIVEFSGLEDRIDHPMKTYSTGMIMRIGFSVAVHVPFDILIVDEVLSVGDYLFQRKCVNAIRSIIASGKTVIITSHSLSDVSSFCDRLMLIQNGRIDSIGDTDKVIQQYIEHCECTYAQIEAPVVEDKILSTCKERIGSLRIIETQILDQTNQTISTISTGQTLRVRMKFIVDEPTTNPCIRVQFLRNDGLLVMGANTYRRNLDYGQMHGQYEIIIDFRDFSLLEGEYYINVGIWPDEWKSYTAKTPYDIQEYRNVINVTSQREDGGGLTRANETWTLNRLSETP